MTAHVVGSEVAPARVGYPLVVASLPGRDAESLREQAQAASEAGADLVEIRLDRLPASEIPRLERVHDIPILHPWVPAIATLRSQAQGGEGPNDPALRAPVLRRALEALPFSFVDLELERDEPLVPQFREFDGRPMSLVRSAHLPEGTPTPRVLALLEAGMSEGDLAKVVLPSSAERVVQDLVPAISLYCGRPFVLHTTGPAGALLRVLAPRLGMAWVFGRLPERDPPAPSGQPQGGHADPAAPVEPSQLPVDRLRRFVDAGPESPWFAVVGHPVGHSLSPAIHASFLEANGNGGIYIPLELTSEAEFMSVLPRLVSVGLRGANVTRPYKPAAARLAARRSETVSQSHAANTLVVLAPPSRGFAAHNTDVDALDRWWKEILSTPSQPARDRVLVVGTGGAARAAVLASLRSRLAVSVLGRHDDAARALASEFAPSPVRVATSADLSPFPWVVHATPVGQDAGATLDVPMERALSRGSLLVDLVYRPREPRLREIAERAGATYVDGWKMFTYQAAASFELFTGKPVPSALIDRWLTAPGPVGGVAA